MLQGIQPGLFQLRLAVLQAALLGKPLTQLVLARGFVEAAIRQLGFNDGQLFMQLAKFLFQLVGLLAMRRQLLAKCRRGLALRRLSVLSAAGALVCGACWRAR